jgi:hypothetical protein
MQAITIIQWTTLGLAAAAAVLAGLSLWLNAATNTRIDQLPKPAWMGQWPPARGCILNSAYDYSHLSFDWLRPGEAIYVGAERWAMRSANAGSLIAKGFEQAASPENIEATGSGSVNASSAAQFRIKLRTRIATNDGDALPRRESPGQADLLVSIASKRSTQESRLPQMSLYRPAGGETNILDSHIEEPSIDHPDGELTIGIGDQATLVFAGCSHLLTIIQLANGADPQRHHLDSSPVAPDRPACVDHAQGGAQQRDTQRNSVLQILVSHPSAPDSPGAEHIALRLLKHRRAP